MTVELKLSERLLDMQRRRVYGWSLVDQNTVVKAIWALRNLEAITDAWNSGTSSWHETMKDWPELYDLLDVLIKEENDGTN